MPPPFKSLLPFFFGRDPDDEGELEDPIKFIENVKSTLDLRRYTDETKRPIAIGVIFRLHLRGKAALWYRNLSPNTRTNWNQLEAAFLSRFKTKPDKPMDPNRFFKLLYNFKQNGRTISEYIEEGDQLSSQCPIVFKRSLVGSFVTGLDEGKKIYLALYYLKSLRIKGNVSYAQVKHAVIKAHQLLERQNSSNTVRNYLPPKPLTSVTQSGLLLSSQWSAEFPCLEPSDNAPYRPLNTSQNKTGQIQADHSIYCNHCREEGHNSINCTKLVASSAQRDASRLSINKLQNVPRQLPLSQYLPSHNQAKLQPQSLDQAHEYPQGLNQVRQTPQSPNQAQQYSLSLCQTYQYPQSLNQNHQYSQSPNQAHELSQSLYQAYQYPMSLHQDHQYPQSPNQPPPGLYQAYPYPQSPKQAPQGIYQAYQYPQSPNQAHKCPQSLNQAPQSLHQDPQTLHQAHNYPQSLNQAPQTLHQDPQTLHQDYQYPQGPNQAPQGIYQAYQDPQSPNQTHKYPQSLIQAPQSLLQDHQSPQSSNQALQIPYQVYQYSQSPGLNQAHQYPQSLNQAYQYPLSPIQVYQHPQSINQAHQYTQGLDQTRQYPPVSIFSSCAGASFEL